MDFNGADECRSRSTRPISLVKYCFSSSEMNGWLLGSLVQKINWKKTYQGHRYFKINIITSFITKNNFHWFLYLQITQWWRRLRYQNSRRPFPNPDTSVLAAPTKIYWSPLPADQFNRKSLKLHNLASFVWVLPALHWTPSHPVCPSAWLAPKLPTGM